MGTFRKVGAVSGEQSAAMSKRKRERESERRRREGESVYASKQIDRERETERAIEGLPSFSQRLICSG